MNEIFHWGRYGGFGALTRTLGSELVKQNVEVYVLLPQQSLDQRPIETIDGMNVLGIPTNSKHFSLVPSLRSRSFLKLCDADLYHSEEPSVATYIAEKVESKKKHIVTLQDPFYIDDLKKFKKTILKCNLSPKPNIPVFLLRFFPNCEYCLLISPTCPQTHNSPSIIANTCIDKTNFWSIKDILSFKNSTNHALMCIL